MNTTKPKMLYASPVLPQKSGISDYSEVLIWSLQDFFDISLLVAEDCSPENSKIREELQITPYHQGINCREYDCILYNFGNNPYFHSYIYDCFLSNPGYVILHDYVLYYLTSGYYHDRKRLYEALYALEGANGVHIYADARKRNGMPPTEQVEIANRLPMNKEIIEQARSVFVHSDFTKDLIMKRHPQAPTHRINMVNMADESRLLDVTLISNQYGIKEDAFVIASFGYVAETKQNQLVCQAVDLYNRTHDEKIYYIMAGDGAYVDNYLNDYIIRTGYIERNLYDSIMLRADVVANLRYPSMGETSISAIHAMGMGKICLVTDYAWFSELPDEAVIKISKDASEEQLAELFLKLRERPDEYQDIAQAAKRLVQQSYSADAVAQSIYDVIKKNVPIA